MNVALLLVTHNKIATSLSETACSIIGHNTENIACIEIPMDTPVEETVEKIEDELGHLDTHDGTLILTDMYGGTPSNISNRFVEKNNTIMLSGLNLPMLIRIMNYRSLPLNELTQKAIEGGHDGIALYGQEVI